ncbi:MAG TPA: hypothetical protein VKV26_21705 [Dehalococcoidia bacterium]|nr:hypothetical protein [Dehalococcoidia bacterium]
MHLIRTPLPRPGAVALAIGAALAVACSSGGSARPRPTPFAAGSFDPRSVPTVATPSSQETAAARAAAGNALQALAGASGGAVHLLDPAILSGASVVDVLRVSAPAGIGADQARMRLPALGWRWLVSWSAVEASAARYREWRVELFGFASAANAGRYAAEPFLEPAPLLAAGKQPPPDGAASDAALYRAADAITPPLQAVTPAPGERGVLIWRRGRIVAAVSEAQTPAGLDLPRLAALSRSLDAGLLQVPGSLDQ